MELFITFMLHMLWVIYKECVCYNLGWDLQIFCIDVAWGEFRTSKNNIFKSTLRLGVGTMTYSRKLGHMTLLAMSVTNLGPIEGLVLQFHMSKLIIKSFSNKWLMRSIHYEQQLFEDEIVKHEFELYQYKVTWTFHVSWFYFQRWIQSL